MSEATENRFSHFSDEELMVLGPALDNDVENWKKQAEQDICQSLANEVGEEIEDRGLLVEEES